MSIRKILDQLSEMATVSGSVATVATPMGATQRRTKESTDSKESIFSEDDAVCPTCHQHECQCDANSRKAPESPEVANFGLWKNSILAGKEQKAKKKLKVKESVTDYNPPSQGGTRKELLAKLRSAKSAAERSDLATRARKAGASQDELMSASAEHIKSKKQNGHTEFKGIDDAVLRSKGMAEEFDPDVERVVKAWREKPFTLGRPEGLPILRKPDEVKSSNKKSTDDIDNLDETSEQYQGQYPSKAEAIAYAKEKVKSFRDWQDGIEIWSLPSGEFDVVHTTNSNGRNHVVKNGGKKLGTIYPEKPAYLKKKGVAEGTEETPQQQKVRTAISNGLAKSSQMGKSEYQSQPTKRTYFDNAGYASDKLTGIDSIDPDGTVVISMGDTRAGVWVKKLATLGGMPGVKTRESQPKKDVAEGDQKQLSVQQLATISDEALDNAYHYGRSTPGNTFGWQANLKSAAYAKQMIDRGITDIEAISDAIHKGWNVTAKAFVQNPDQFDDTEKLRAAGKLESKLQQRAKLMNIGYAQLPDEEQEKDRVVARALLQALKGKQGVAEAYDDSMTDAEWERESQREKSEKEQTRKEIQKNHVSKFKTKDEAIQYANDKLKTFKDSKIGMSVYAMPDGGFDVVSTARNSAGEKRRKLMSDAGGKHLGTLGPRYTKHKMAEGSSERNEMDTPEFQSSLARMKNRHQQDDKNFDLDSAKELGRRLAARGKRDDSDKNIKEIDAGQGQRALKLAERDVEEGLGDIAKNAVKGAKRFMKGKPTVGQSIDDHESTARGAESKREVFSVTGNSKLSSDMSHQANREHEKAARIKNKFAPLNLAEQDFILNPHDVRRVPRDVVPKIDPRQDHEVEMACSDLFQAAKNARTILQLIKDTPESVGLEGWVQEKIIKASDYLNTVREYLEGQGVRSAMSGNFNMGNMLDESVDNPLESALVRRFMSQHTDVLQQYGPTNVLNAIEDVASDFNSGDELGTSDVSAYVRRVLSYLDNNYGNQVDENVAATLMATAAAGAGGILATKIIAMIDDARNRVKDMREKRKLEAELNKVEKYLDSSSPVAESKIVKTRK